EPPPAGGPCGAALSRRHTGTQRGVRKPRHLGYAWAARRGGRAVECGGLENRFGRFRPTRVQIPPPPPPRAKKKSSMLSPELTAGEAGVGELVERASATTVPTGHLTV